MTVPIASLVAGVSRSCFQRARFEQSIMAPAFDVPVQEQSAHKGHLPDAIQFCEKLQTIS
jgi:hypothetical protein